MQHFVMGIKEGEMENESNDFSVSYQTFVSANLCTKKKKRLEYTLL